MRKITLFITVLTVLVCLNGCSDTGNKTDATIPESGVLTITFDYEKQSGHASNQFAVWIEDMDGNYVKTLYATRYTANGGYKNRPDSIFLWVEKSELASMEKSDVDALTSATPKEGALSYVWDLTDKNGDEVTPGEYRFFVEGSLRWKNRVLYTGVVDISGTAVTVQGEAEYIYESSNGQPVLTAEASENNMVNGVTASWEPKVHAD